MHRVDKDPPVKPEDDSKEGRKQIVDPGSAQHRFALQCARDGAVDNSRANQFMAIPDAAQHAMMRCRSGIHQRDRK